MELHQTFLGATFATFTDKFGTHWRLNFVKNNTAHMDTSKILD